MPAGIIILLQDTCCLDLYDLPNLWLGDPSSHQVLYLTTSEAMMALTSIQLSRLQILVEPVPDTGCPHGSINKAAAIGSEGAEEVGACHLPSRKSVLNEAEKPSQEAMLPISSVGIVRVKGPDLWHLIV